MSIAVYVGSFDPLTFGHLDIIKRGAKLFEKLIVGIGVNSAKDCYFTLNERLDLLKECTKDFQNVEIRSFQGLVVGFAKANNCQIMLRGLRELTDFDYEFQMALANKDLDASLETIFLITSPQHIFISSSMVKEIFQNGGDVSKYAPAPVIKKLKEKIKSI
jgi:pantetheine-phosphate adenylyltransferase